MFQKELLPPQPTTVTPELPVAADDSVAWDQNGQTVVSIRPGDSPTSGWTLNVIRQRVVHSSTSIRELSEPRPDRGLERATSQHQGRGEDLEFPREIPLELYGQLPSVCVGPRSDPAVEQPSETRHLGLEHRAVGEFE